MMVIHWIFCLPSTPNMQKIAWLTIIKPPAASPGMLFSSWGSVACLNLS